MVNDMVKDVENTKGSSHANGILPSPAKPIVESADSSLLNSSAPLPSNGPVLTGLNSQSPTFPPKGPSKGDSIQPVQYVKQPREPVQQVRQSIEQPVSPERNSSNQRPLASTPSPSRNSARQSPSRLPRDLRRDIVTPSNVRTRPDAARSSSRRSPRRRDDTNSPSRQILDDLARFHIDSDIAFKNKLDQKSARLAQQHRVALEDAAQKHAAVLRGALQARDVLQIQMENDAIRRRIEQEAQLEKAKREKLELEAAERQRKVEAAQEAEREVQRRRDQERATLEAEERARVENERLATEKKKREEDAQNARRETEARRIEEENAAKGAEERAKVQAQQASAIPVAVAASKSSLPTATPPSGVPLMPWNELEATHAEYLKLHQKLKDMRKNMVAAYKQVKNNQGSQLAKMFEMRRLVSKLLGQTNNDRVKNREVRNEIEQIMETAWNITDVALDAKEYILRPTNPWPAGGNTQVSGVFIYLVNVVSKMAIKQMGASSRQTSFNAVDYYGVILSWIVSKSKFRLHGNSFADIVLAKFHVACPPLFGIFGSENTAAGRQRLGWKDGMNNQTHYDNVNALAIGWGALTLRDYTRMAGESSAFPAWYYWQTIACIVNVPPKQLTTTHGILLKGLIDLYADKFIKFYGQAAIVALRQALIKLPGEAPESAAFSKVEVVRDNLKKKYGLNL